MLIVFFLFSNQLKEFVFRSWVKWQAKDWNPTPRTFDHRNLMLHSPNNIRWKQSLFIVHINVKTIIVHCLYQCYYYCLLKSQMDKKYSLFFFQYVPRVFSIHYNQMWMLHLLHAFAPFLSLCIWRQQLNHMDFFSKIWSFSKSIFKIMKDIYVIFLVQRIISFSKQIFLAVPKVKISCGCKSAIVHF